MAEFKIFRETALPGTLQPYAIYLVAPAATPQYVEMYVTNNDGTAAKRNINEADIQTMIDASVAGLSGLEIVADITERDALTLSANAMVLVLDATSETDVTSGGATYAYRHSNTSWTKVSETESMDISLSWASIVGKPTSTANDIDAAVANSHTHANKTQLDLIGQDGNGNLTYNGSTPVISWDSEGW